MVEIKIIDIHAKDNQEEMFEKQVSSYLLKGYELLSKSDRYAKLMFKTIYN